MRKLDQFRIIDIFRSISFQDLVFAAKIVFCLEKPNKALEKADPLADAVMVYVAESGASKEETEANLEKLEQEKKMAIELRKRVNFSFGSNNSDKGGLF